MKTTIEVDEVLLREAQETLGTKDREQLVKIALVSLINRREQWQQQADRASLRLRLSAIFS